MVARPVSAIVLVEVAGVQARWDRQKGILIDPPFGPWPRPAVRSAGSPA